MNAAAPGGHWQHQALCRTLPPHILDPAMDDAEGVALARGVCRNCPVKAVCLRTAVIAEGAWPAQHRAGIRGGYTPAERLQVYRQYLAEPRTAAV